MRCETKQNSQAAACSEGRCDCGSTPVWKPVEGVRGGADI
jgi:hypothetical protein